MLFEGLEPEFVIGNKRYDSDALRDKIRSIGGQTRDSRVARCQATLKLTPLATLKLTRSYTLD
jgi:hypothetical protein